ncbi:ATP-dependent nuclease [Bradyrhizobium sp. CCBAU 25360]|uniref:ATP-dependent nuclease n=1 Tax=Bradyrhizobium sp. CCBAU 25360 TaxID=858425 RepID=UPI0023052F28|nr:AAA family ATPase [Bradyrhizobium sp. CCBAU 25360]
MSTIPNCVGMGSLRYKSFRIQNFKGIKDTTVELSALAGASVFAFVGLNESGKTTILEAIHSFSPDSATSELLGGDHETGVPFKERVPRHVISTFTGYVSVAATILLSAEDKTSIADTLLEKNDLVLDVDSFPDTVVMVRQQRFENGDFKQSFFTLVAKYSVRNKKQKRWREATEQETVLVRNAVYSETPDIAYFPTFVFDFPESIFLTERGNAIDAFYRSVFQDILDFDNRGHTIEKDIVGRIRSHDMVIPWLTFLTTWGAHDSKDKIQHVMDRASAAVSRLVFGKWNKIFGEDTRGKEVVISFDVVEGETDDGKGTKAKTQEHDVKIKFQIRDGTRRFNVNDRSLGFRWFFAFMLFTQFRVARSSSRPMLFLFDEPASNLHSAAQEKLIECFPEIATADHTLAYTTHSHYMIEPKWLEQTFIVTNRADAPRSSILDEISLDDESLDVKVATYRSFVNEHPSQTSYFQPILDRLEVVPSRFDLQKTSIVVEGRSDYYILRYAANLLNRSDLPILPGLGAGTFGALVSLHIGWNLRFFFLLDGDRQGKDEKTRYVTEYGIPVNRIGTIDELVPGIAQIEDLLDDEASDRIRDELKLANRPSKGQIKRFFQERLAMSKVSDLGSTFHTRAKTLLDALAAKLT